jgi:hypothetical protein
VLMSIIDQHGDDPAVGKKAADTVKRIGTPQEFEQAALILSTRFPADPGVWLRVAEARAALAEDGLALQAYQKALQFDPGDLDVRRGVEQTEAILRLDPTRKGLSARERAGRWTEILRRMAAGAEACGQPQVSAAIRPLLSAAVPVDKKMEQARTLWPQLKGCNTDTALPRLMARIDEGIKP